MPYPFLNPREKERVKRIAESQKTTVYQVMRAIVKVGLNYIEQEKLGIMQQKLGTISQKRTTQ